MSWKKILAIGLGIVLVAEAGYLGLLLTRDAGQKASNVAKPSALVAPSPQTKNRHYWK